MNRWRETLICFQNERNKQKATLIEQLRACLVYGLKLDNGG